MTRKIEIVWGALVALVLIGGSLMAPPVHALLIGSALNS